MHFKGTSVAQTELKKVKSETFSRAQCQIAKHFSVATVLLPDDWHIAVQILSITAQMFYPME